MKPRILLIRQGPVTLWACYGCTPGRGVGYGMTPREAFDNWARA